MAGRRNFLATLWAPFRLAGGVEAQAKPLPAALAEAPIAPLAGAS